MKWLEIIRMIAPIITTIAVPGPGGAILGGLIAHGIETAETIKGATGGQKLAKAIELVNTGVAGVNAVHPNLLDPTLVNNTAISVIDTIVQTANLVKGTPAGSNSNPPQPVS